MQPLPSPRPNSRPFSSPPVPKRSAAIGVHNHLLVANCASRSPVPNAAARKRRTPRIAIQRIPRGGRATIKRRDVATGRGTDRPHCVGRENATFLPARAPKKPLLRQSRAAVNLERFRLSGSSGLCRTPTPRPGGEFLECARTRPAGAALAISAATAPPARERMRARRARRRRSSPRRESAARIGPPSRAHPPWAPGGDQAAGGGERRGPDRCVCRPRERARARRTRRRRIPRRGRRRSPWAAVPPRTPRGGWRRVGARIPTTAGRPAVEWAVVHWRWGQSASNFRPINKNRGILLRRSVQAP